MWFGCLVSLIDCYSLRLGVKFLQTKRLLGWSSTLMILNLLYSERNYWLFLFAYHIPISTRIRLIFVLALFLFLNHAPWLAGYFASLILSINVCCLWFLRGVALTLRARLHIRGRFFHFGGLWHSNYNRLVNGLVFVQSVLILLFVFEDTCKLRLDVGLILSVCFLNYYWVFLICVLRNRYLWITISLRFMMVNLRLRRLWNTWQ